MGEAVSLTVEAYLHTRVKDREGHLKEGTEDYEKKKEGTEDYEKKKEGVRVRTCTEPEAANVLSCA